VDRASFMPDNSRMEPQGFSENSRLRASDADRDRAAAVINHAMAEGRLTADEHSERLDAIYAARTHADIVPLLDDLPGQALAAPASAPATAQVARTGRIDRIKAIFGGASRKGRWQAEPEMDVVTVFGGVELDFRDAVLPGKEITLNAVVVFGGLEITVPPEMRVIDSGSAIMGGREVAGDSPESGQADAPVLRISGPCVFGGVEVRRKDRKDGKGRNWRAISAQ
jgi:hypothetical protein